MSYKKFQNIERQDVNFEVADLCRSALQKIGPSGHFRVRVLLEMILIQLAVDDPKPLQPDPRLS